MARRKGIFGRLFSAAKKLVQREAPKPPAKPPAKPPVSRPPTLPPTPVRRNARTEAKAKMMGMPFANADNVDFYITQMDDDEITWLIDATPKQIAWRSRQDADRYYYNDEGDMIPLNPFWYH